MFAHRTNWNLHANRLSEALARHRSAGLPLIDLSISNPTKCGFHYDSAAIMRALCSPAALRYEPEPKGLATTRQSVAAYYRERGAEVSPESIVLTASTSEGYSHVFRTLCNAGDELLIPAPSYPLFDFLADLHDVRLSRYPLVYDHGWQIDFHVLEQAITPRTRGVIVVHPNNPTGHFTKIEEMKRLNEVCSSRQMALIADEVFLDFALNGDARASFAANKDAVTFTMSGLSKISGLPQMKAAWVVTSGPEPVKSQALARLEVIADTFLSVNTPVQLATPVFLEQRRGFQAQLIARVKKNLEALDRQLTGQQSCSRLEVEGGWYAVIRVPATHSDEELAIELLNAKNVHVHPGHFYDFSADGYLIVSLITPEQEFVKGIGLLLSMF